MKEGRNFKAGQLPRKGMAHVPGGKRAPSVMMKGGMMNGRCCQIDLVQSYLVLSAYLVLSVI